MASSRKRRIKNHLSLALESLNKHAGGQIDVFSSLHIATGYMMIIVGENAGHWHDVIRVLDNAISYSNADINRTDYDCRYTIIRRAILQALALLETTEQIDFKAPGSPIMQLF